MGYARMADLMLTGRVLTAAEGERANLCQYVVPKGEALERAKSLAARIAKNATLTNYYICSGLPRVTDMSHDDGLFVEELIFSTVGNPEGYERGRAFVEKKAARLAPHKYFAYGPRRRRSTCSRSISRMSCATRGSKSTLHIPVG